MTVVCADCNGRGTFGGSFYVYESCRTCGGSGWVKDIDESYEQLKVMLTDYKNLGDRLDEILFQEVSKVIEKHQKANDLLEKLYYEMGKGPDEDVQLWREVKSYVRSDSSLDIQME